MLCYVMEPVALPQNTPCQPSPHERTHERHRKSCHGIEPCTAKAADTSRMTHLLLLLCAESTEFQRHLYAPACAPVQ